MAALETNNSISFYIKRKRKREKENKKKYSNEKTIGKLLRQGLEF